MTNRPSLFLMGLLIGVISGWVLADNPVLLGAEDSWPPSPDPMARDSLMKLSPRPSVGLGAR